MAKLPYSEATEKLLQRMDRVALRKEHVFDKPEITRLIGEVYSFLELKVPDIVWCKDITDKRFAEAAWAAEAARVAGAAGAARAAGAAWVAGAAGAAGAAWVAGAAEAARAAGAAGAARAAGVDWDFDYFVFEHEFLQSNKGNENDRKALRAYQYFLELKEAGMGYFAEEDGKLYVCPNPVVSLDENLRYHSLTGPAIYWPDGLEVYYLHGVNFSKKLWADLGHHRLSAKDVLRLPNNEQRMMALKVMNPEKMLEAVGAKLIDSSPRKNTLYLIEGITREPFYALKMHDPYTNRVYIEYLRKDFNKEGYSLKADDAQAWLCGLTPKEYARLKVET